MKAFAENIKTVVQNCQDNLSFVQPRLTKKDSLEEKHTSLDIQLNDILTSDKSSTLIYGNAGIGKTALANWALQEWSHGRWAGHHTAVFVLDMYSLVKRKDKISLSLLLTELSNFNPTQPQPQLFQWLKHNNSRVVIWLGNMFFHAIMLIKDITSPF